MPQIKSSLPMGISDIPFLVIHPRIMYYILSSRQILDRHPQHGIRIQRRKNFQISVGIPQKTANFGGKSLTWLFSSLNFRKFYGLGIMEWVTEI